MSIENDENIIRILDEVIDEVEKEGEEVVNKKN